MAHKPVMSDVATTAGLLCCVEAYLVGCANSVQIPAGKKEDALEITKVI